MYGTAQHRDGKHAREFHVFNVRLHPDLHQKLQRLADRNGETLAATVREMLRTGVELREAE